MADPFVIHDRDLQELVCADTLDVFRRSPVLRQIQTVQARETQVLYDAIVNTLRMRTLDAATGAQLDAIGRIVGAWPRPTRDAYALEYFTPDTERQGPDWTGAYVINAPVATQLPLDDPQYRTVIRVQIAKNHTKYGSAPEILYFARMAYGVELSVRNIGLSDLAITLPPSLPPPVAAQIVASVTDETADLKYNLPLPTTSRIRQVRYFYTDSFAPDLYAGAPDVAPIGVTYELNP